MSQPDMDFNQYYKAFCEAVDKRAAAGEATYERHGHRASCDGENFIDELTPYNDLMKDGINDRASCDSSHKLPLFAYQETLKMRLFDLVDTFKSVSQWPEEHPDNIVQVYARADGLIAVIGQHRVLTESSDNLAPDPASMKTEVTSVNLFGVMEKSPAMIHVARRAFNAHGDTLKDGNNWRFSIDAEKEPGKIIDILAPAMISPWPEPSGYNFFMADYELTHLVPMDPDFEDPGAYKLRKAQDELHGQRAAQLPLHIRQMIGHEACEKEPANLNRSRENAAYLVHYVPKALRLG